MHLRLSFAAAAVVFAVTSLPAAAEGVIGLDAVKAGLKTGQILLVDVREPDEFVAGHVPGAVNMPLSHFDPAALPKPADKTVVVMCRSGHRAGIAQAAAAKVGRTDIVDYAGSMIEWTGKGEPIVTGR